MIAVARVCALAFLLTAQASPDLTLVRVGAATDDQSKPVLYAQQAGLFAKAGLNVQVVPLNGGGAAIAAAVSGGSLDIGKANTLLLITAHSRNLPFTAIAPGVITGASDHAAALIVPANSPLKTGRDFNGKTVGVTSLVTIELLATRTFIDRNGGDSSTVKFVEVAPSTSLAAMDQGRIDGASILEPALSQALSTGRVRVFAYTYSAIAPRFDGADWFTTTDFAGKHRDVVAKFARVMHDANVYVAAHETETNPLVAAYAGIDLATLSNMHHVERPTYLNPAYIQPLIDAAVKYKFIAQPFPAQELINEYALKPPR
ncbi:MAG TPA: ABC transporter substrate-binding protein [Candidatus Binatia bacterium]|nr:ABC transporter substrate-binding protein [Candidatus Binatia bacterium]